MKGAPGRDVPACGVGAGVGTAVDASPEIERTDGMRHVTGFPEAGEMGSLGTTGVTTDHRTAVRPCLGNTPRNDHRLL